MIIEKVITFIMGSALALTLVSLNGTTSMQFNSDIMQLGKQQTSEIREVLERNGIQTSDCGQVVDLGTVAISNGEDNSSLENTTGYTVTTLERQVPNNGEENSYSIDYTAVKYDNTRVSELGKKDKGKVKYEYAISILIPSDEEFDIQNVSMFKELIKIIDSEYDFKDFNSIVNNVIMESKSGIKAVSKNRHGQYKESITVGASDDNLGQIVLYKATLV